MHESGPLQNQPVATVDPPQSWNKLPEVHFLSFNDEYLRNSARLNKSIRLLLFWLRLHHRNTLIPLTDQYRLPSLHPKPFISFANAAPHYGSQSGLFCQQFRYILVICPRHSARNKDYGVWAVRCKSEGFSHARSNTEVDAKSHGQR